MTGVNGDPSAHRDVADELTLGLLPEERLLDHPLIRGTVIRTEPCLEAYLEFKRRLCFGLNGFSLLAESGMGRKSAMISIRSQLFRDFPSLAVAEITLRRDAPHTTRARWQALLSDLGHRALKGSNEDLRSRVLWMLEERLYGSPLPHLVLFIRNVEYLDGDLTRILLDLSDALNRKGFRMFVVSCGQIARFGLNLSTVGVEAANDMRSLLGSPFALRALNSEEDLAVILEEIDTQIIGPEDPRHWGESFLPKAYQNGFSLKDQSARLLAAMADIPQGTVTTHTVFDSIRWVLVTSSGNDQSSFMLPERIWNDALLIAQSARFVPLLENSDGHNDAR
ncbi:hypothetical protein [Paraburkholderia sp. ZP32-5]|uniref:hypothetical protein n=1 Tax=Paraburkholderia sp. ZP32-5 TaxID=2883245 RepID=UPI001F264F04|nr:hypothetical protein [Paraburkholderia sp. ZP32-5]